MCFGWLKKSRFEVSLITPLNIVAIALVLAVIPVTIALLYQTPNLIGSAKLLPTLIAFSTKDNYLEGESVVFGVKNDAQRRTVFQRNNPWQIQRPDQVGNWYAIFTPPSASLIWALEPGSSRTWQWEGQDAVGNAAPSGKYRVVIFSESVSATTEFNLSQR